jgi:hypothetical protein
MINWPVSLGVKPHLKARARFVIQSGSCNSFFKGSVDGVWHTELLDFRTFSIARWSWEQFPKRRLSTPTNTGRRKKSKKSSNYMSCNFVAVRCPL